MRSGLFRIGVAMGLVLVAFAIFGPTIAPFDPTEPVSPHLAEPTPPGMDWEMWLGPAPWAPYNSKRCSGDFATTGGSWRSLLPEA